MKKRICILIVLLLLFAGDLIWFVKNIENHNVFTVLITLCVVPSVLIGTSIGITINMLNIRRNLKFLCCSVISLVYSALFYFFINSHLTADVAKNIVENTKKLAANSKNISITNISVDNDSSSSILNFLIVFAVSVIVTIIFESRRKNKERLKS